MKEHMWLARAEAGGVIWPCAFSMADVGDYGILPRIGDRLGIIRQHLLQPYIYILLIKWSASLSKSHD